MDTLAEGQVVIYSDARFGGRSKAFSTSGKQSVDVPNSDGLGPVGNDAVSSVRVGKGVKLELFADSGFRGGKLTLFEGNYPHLLDWNDKVTGLKVVKSDPAMFPVVMFYVDNNKGDEYATRHGLSVGEYADSSQLLKNDSYTLVDVPAGVDVTVFEHFNYSGYSQTFSTPGLVNLSQYGFNDKTSSIRITSQVYVLTDVVFSNERILSIDPQETIATKVSTYNASAATVTSSLNIQTTKVASVTATKEYSQMYGATFTIGKKLTYPGLAGIELSLAISTEQTITSGESKTQETQQQVASAVSIEVPPHSQVKGSLLVTPVTKQYDVTYVYRKTDKNGEVIPGGEVREVKGKVELKFATDAQVSVEDIK